MLTVHHLNNSRSQRILWLLEELGVEYQIQKHQRDPQTSLAPPSLKAVHPLGHAPVLESGDTKLAESGAIVQYLIDQYGKDSFKVPSETATYQQYLFWCHFAEGSLMPPLVATLVMNKAKQKVPGLVRPLAKKILNGIMDNYYGPNLDASLRYVEAYLAKHDWFAGEGPGGADVMMIFPLEAALARSQDQRWTAISSFVKRVHNRPAYQRALEKGGPYDYA